MHYLLVLSVVFALSVQEHTTFQQKRQQNGGGGGQRPSGGSSGRCPDSRGTHGQNRPSPTNNNNNNNNNVPPPPPLVFNSATVCAYKNLSRLSCDPSYKYASYDGSCNNLQNSAFGRSELPYKRFLPPAYADGVGAPRGMSTPRVSTLPNPRTVSLSLTQPSQTDRLEQLITELFPLFGQFVTHDITGLSAINDQFGVEKECQCGSTDPDCMLAVTWPQNDPFLNQACMFVTRSSPAFPFPDCSPAYREQLNLLTPFLDGSQIYGMDADRAAALRTFKGGMLATSPGTPANGAGITGRTYLPLSNETCALAVDGTAKCFFGGEFRTSENLGLVSMQTLFNREHNRIAAQLARRHPQWSDQTLYMEARRINTAQYQHVIFKEWLPIVAGDSSLSPLGPTSYFEGYDSSINPALYNEFATAAFRMGHSLMRQKLNRYNVQHQNLGVGKSFDLETIVFHTELAFDGQSGGLNSILTGLLEDQAWKFGSFGSQLQNNLFRVSDPQSPMQAVDLLSLNINRGRDHGFQPYVNYVKRCQNKIVTTFDDLRAIMSDKNVKALQNVYKTVFDIDLYAGGLMETNSDPTHVVGPTFACIIMGQFSELKRADRFYYENSPSKTASAFTTSQLAQIKKVSMASLLCENFDIWWIQRNPFYKGDTNRNPFSNCDKLTNQLDLSQW